MGGTNMLPCMLVLCGTLAIAVAATPSFSGTSRRLTADGAFRVCVLTIPGVKIIFKEDALYESTRQIFHNLRVLPGRMPLAFGLPKTAKEAARLLQCATASSIPVSVRGGGHNYEGLCLVNNGLVIDTSQMTQIQLGKRGKTSVVTVGAGQRTGPVNMQLWATSKQIIPTGVCDSVGIGGVTLGGGIGPQLRKAGLTLDSLVEATVVTAAGQELTVNATSNGDLFFALRGGGGNYALLTSLTFRLTTPPKTASVLRVKWPNTQANIKAVLTAWFQANPFGLASEYSYVELYIGKGTRSPRILIYYWGPKAVLRKYYTTSPIFKAGTGMTLDLLQEMPFGEYLGFMMNQYDGTPLSKNSMPEVIARSLVGRPSFQGSSAFLKAPLDAAAIDKVAALMQSKISTAWIQFHALGGAVNKVAVGATAFPHRTDQYQLQIKIFEDTGMTWVRSIQSALGSAATGLQYLNYLDTDTADPWATYFGPNAGKLKLIKSKYDPNGVFDALHQR